MKYKVYNKGHGWEWLEMEIIAPFLCKEKELLGMTPKNLISQLRIFQSDSQVSMMLTLVLP